ncbi:MAG TPA: hypothetical protein VF458_22795 [Ktedonobacteraceae bacterium]
MSHENERPANFWDDEDETEIASREAYLRAFNRKRPQPRSDNPLPDIPETPTRRPRPRGVPGSADFYEEIEGDPRPARPRSTRQSREEVEARLRQQRGRQAASAREQDGLRTRPDAPVRKQAPHASEQKSGNNPSIPRLDPARQPRPTTRDFSSPRATRDFTREAPRTTRDFAQEYPAQRGRETDYDDYDEIEIIEEPARPPQRRRGRSVFTTLLTGCLGGLLTLLVVAGVLVFLVLHNTSLGQNLGVGKSIFNQSSLQGLTLGSSTQVIVKNQAGNIAISIDQGASAATLTSVKHVQASSQSDANNQFKQIKLSVTMITRGTDPSCLAASCLLVSATTSTSGGGLFGGSNGNSVDLTITLPASFNSPETNAPNIIAASTSAGNINVSGFVGMLNLNGSAGTTNINITRSLIFAGTCIQTMHGNVTIAQGSTFDLSTPPQWTTPCDTILKKDPLQPWFVVKSSVGNVNITLTTNLNNMLLDAYTNNGHIIGDFNLNITVNGDSATYHGPVLPNTNPTAALYVNTSTGDITLHKQ